MSSLLDEVLLLNKQSSIKALLFDVDGTIVDTMESHYVSWHQALAEFDAQITDDEMKNHRGATSEHIVEYLNLTKGYSLNYVAVSDRKEQIFSLMQVQNPSPYIPHVIDVIHYGATQGWVIAACTGGLFENIQASLQRVGVLGFFSRFFTASDGLKQKTTSDYWSDVATSLRVLPAHCIVLEDSPICIKAAQSSGMHALQIEDYRK